MAPNWRSRCLSALASCGGARGTMTRQETRKKKEFGKKRVSLLTWIGMVVFSFCWETCCWLGAGGGSEIFSFGNLLEAFGAHIAVHDGGGGQNGEWKSRDMKPMFRYIVKRNHIFTWISMMYWEGLASKTHVATMLLFKQKKLFVPTIANIIRTTPEVVIVRYQPKRGRRRKSGPKNSGFRATKGWLI